jgi:putative lipase involved disintegration of autophagic bodies
LGAFGEVDDLEVTLTGRSKGGATASCKGTAKQAPGLSFEATLVRMVDN